MTATINSKPFGIIYCITNTVNGKRYIGQTTMPLYKRWHAHQKAYGRCVSISAAIQKYGAGAFEVVEIDRAYNRQDLDAKEISHIELAGTLSPVFGYNLRPGGMSVECSDETRSLMSARKKGGKLTDEHKAKIRAAGIGRRHSELSIQKQSLAKLGKPKTPEHRANMRKPRPDYVMSDAHKLAISKASTGAVFSAGRRAKISDALTGRIKGPLSEETKAKLSLVNKGTTRTPEQRQRMSEGRKKAHAARQQAALI